MGINEDRAFAKAVYEGESNACTRFIEKYTKNVLWRVLELMEGDYCKEPAKAVICSLLIIKRQREGSTYFPEDQCDICMDSYLWFFEYLKNKVKFYEGRNNCSLSTFVHSIVSSEYIKIDWIRWKTKKRCGRPPACIKKLDSIFHKVYQYLCEYKNEDKISELLELSLEEIRDKINKVTYELSKTEQLYLIRKYPEISIHADGPDKQELPLPSEEPGLDEIIIYKELRSITNKAISELPAHQAQLIKHKYKEEMSVEEILGLYKRLGFSPIPNKDISELTVQDIYYEIKKAIKEIHKKIKERKK